MNFNQDKTQRQLIHAEYFEYKRNTVKSKIYLIQRVGTIIQCFWKFTVLLN